MIRSVAEYLDRIECDGGLEDLHRAHLLRVPFENLSIHRGEPITLAPEPLFEKIVRRRRGGFCYELNGLFAELLLALGFEVDRLAARVYGPGGALGIPFDHLCLRVKAEEGVFLCDVGFGDCFVRPLRMEERGEQHDGRTLFRIEDSGEERELWMRDRAGAWVRQYRFALAPFRLSDFEGACHHHQTSPDSPFTQKRVSSLLTELGRVTLRDDRLIERIGEETREIPIDTRDWERLLLERFGIAL
jgi:N-hydroxyarylamine O-acetyltransferase